MKKGFTLIEIIIVLAIVGIMAAVAIPSFRKARNAAQANKSMSLVVLSNNNDIATALSSIKLMAKCPKFEVYKVRDNERFSECRFYVVVLSDTNGILQNAILERP